MTEKNRRDARPEDFDTVEVPAYHESATTNPDTSIYSLTGKAAPTEVMPAANPQATPSPIPAAPDPEPTTGFYTGAPAFETEDSTIQLAEEAAPATVVEQRRGTTDLGLLLLRVLLAGVLIIQSVATFFRLGDSAGISGLEMAFADYSYAAGLAVVVPTLLLAAGVFLLLGLLAPVAALVAVATTGFLAMHQMYAAGTNFNPFYWTAEIWLAVIVFGLALAVQFTGPGRYGVDATRSWARRPLASSWICAVLGIAGAVALWWVGTGIALF